MTADPTSLANLFDLVMPSSVPWWPLAPGWFVVGGLVLLLVGWMAWRTWQRWRAAVFRRAARVELRQLQRQAANPWQREAALRQVPELLKRTALAAFPRQEVASLSGMEWLRFLDRTGHTDAFTQGRGQLLPALAYDPRGAARIGTSEMEDVFSVARHWLDRHSTTMEASVSED